MKGDLVLREFRFSAPSYECNPVCAFDHFDDCDAAVREVAAHALSERVGGVYAETVGEAHGEEGRVLVEGGAESGGGGHG